MDFALTDEQRMIVETTRAFVENELYPHEAEVERTGVLRPELRRRDQGQGDRGRALCRQHAGGGRRRRARHGDLGALREGARPGQLRAALDLRGAALEHPAGRHGASSASSYLFPCVRGEKSDCLAMTEPGAGSDLRGMKATRGAGRRRLGASTAPSTSSAMPTWPTSSSCSRPRAKRTRPRGKRKKRSPPSSSTRARRASPCATATATSRTAATPTAILEFDDCRVPASQVLGEVHKGFEVANAWLGATRLQVAATCLGRAERALGLADRNMRRPRSSSASRSASSRASRSSSPTWRPS